LISLPLSLEIAPWPQFAQDRLVIALRLECRPEDHLRHPAGCTQSLTFLKQYTGRPRSRISIGCMALILSPGSTVKDR